MVHVAGVLAERIRKRGAITSAVGVAVTVAVQILVGGLDLIRWSEGHARMYRYDEGRSGYSADTLVDFLLTTTYLAAAATIVTGAMVLCRGGLLQRGLAAMTVAAGAVASLFIPFRAQTIGPCCEGTFIAARVLPFHSGWWMVDGAVRSVPIVLATAMFGAIAFIDRRPRAMTPTRSTDADLPYRRPAFLVALSIGWVVVVVALIRGTSPSTPHAVQLLAVVVVPAMALALTAAGPDKLRRRLWVLLATLCAALMPMFGSVGWSLREVQIFGLESLTAHEVVMGADDYNKLYTFQHQASLLGPILGLSVLTGLVIRPLLPRRRRGA